MYTVTQRNQSQIFFWPCFFLLYTGRYRKICWNWFFCYAALPLYTRGFTQPTTLRWEKEKKERRRMKMWTEWDWNNTLYNIIIYDLKYNSLFLWEITIGTLICLDDVVRSFDSFIRFDSILDYTRAHNNIFIIILQLYCRLIVSFFTTDITYTSLKYIILW